MNKKKIIIIGFILLFLIVFFLFILKNRTQNFSNYFDKLDAINSYVLTLDELVEPDLNRPDKPDFSKFFEKNSKGKVKNFLDDIFKQAWSIDLFSFLLNKVTKQREDFGYKNDFIIRITPTKNTKFILWGDVCGALHSLVRDLNELKRLDFIDNDLKIKNLDCYFVFNGDFLIRSSYMLESLTLLLRLMEKNPHQILFVKHNLNMFSFGLKNELQYKMNFFSNKRVPLEKELNDYFNTLPMALFIGMAPNKFYEYIKVYNIDSYIYPKLNISNFSGFLVDKTQNNNLMLINLDQERFSIIPPQVKVRITSFQDLNDGNGCLDLITDIKGARTWAAFSSPTFIHQNAIHFFYDTFSIFYPKNDFSDWIITNYYQDVRLKDEFKQKNYSLLTGRLLNQSN